MSNCLVIIDVQKGFMSNDETLKIPFKIKTLVSKRSFDHIVCTQFYNEIGSPYDKLMGWLKLTDDISQEIPPEILEISERVFKKPIYSCFTEEFEKYIKENKINKLYFVGIDIDCCILKSATDSFERNIPLEVLSNYCASNGGDRSFDAALTVMTRMIGNNNINKEL